MPVVATNDVRFLESDDFDAREIRVAIHDGFTLDDPKRPRNYSPQQYMRSEEEEMCELFSDIPEALELRWRLLPNAAMQMVRVCGIFPAAVSTGDMTTEDYLVKKRKRGRRCLAFLFLDEEGAQKRRLEYDERLILNYRLITRWASPLLLIRMELYPVVKR